MALVAAAFFGGNIEASRSFSVFEYKGGVVGPRRMIELRDGYSSRYLLPLRQRKHRQEPVRLRTANRSTSATIAVGKAARTPALMPIRQKGVRRSCAPTRNDPLSGASRAPSGSRATPSRAGSKKVARLPPLSQTLSPAAPSEDDLVLELDELWSFVGKKADKRWVWDRSGARHSSGGRLRYRRANLSEVVGEGPRKVQKRILL